MNRKVVQTARWVGLLLSAMTILAIMAGVASRNEPPKDPQGAPVATSVSTPLGMCPTEDSCTAPDYSAGTWRISGNGQDWSSPIGLCPSEDSCTADYYGSGWNITVLNGQPSDGQCTEEDASPTWWQDPDCTREG